MNVRARSEKQQQVRGRRRARIAMRILTGICALAALGIGATELTSTSLQTFVARPEGVGATPPAQEAATPSPAPKAPPVQHEHAPCRPRGDDIGRPDRPPDSPAPDHGGGREQERVRC
jgi:hypothetical protein